MHAVEGWRGTLRRWGFPLAALLCGVVAVALRAPRCALASEPAGSDWPQYLAGAHALLARGTDPSLAGAWPDWRHALYPMLLGLLSRTAEAVSAARALAWSGVLGMLVGAYLLARALGGRLAGGLAVALVASAATMPVALGWMNPYPLLSGLMAGSLGAAVGSSRSPDLRWPLLSGLLAGAAWAVDPRGAIAIGAAGLAVLLAAARSTRPWMPGAVFVVGVLAGPLVDRIAAPRTHVGMDAEHLARVPLDRQEDEQRARTAEELAARGPSEVAAACTPMDAPGCALALVRHNVGQRREDGDLPPGFVAWVALLALLPRRRVSPRGGHVARRVVGWRASALAFTTLGLPLAAAVWGASRVLFPDRYLLPFLPMLAVAIAVGAMRAWDLAAARAQVLAHAGVAWVGAAALLLATVLAMPRGRVREGASHNGAAVWAWVRASRASGDSVMDCAGLGLDARALPERLHGGRINPAGVDGHACLAWVRRPWDVGDAEAWVLTSAAGPLPSPGADWSLAQVFAAEVQPEEPAVSLWRRRPEAWPAAR